MDRNNEKKLIQLKLVEDRCVDVANDVDEAEADETADIDEIEEIDVVDVADDTNEIVEFNEEWIGSSRDSSPGLGSFTSKSSFKAIEGEPRPAPSSVTYGQRCKCAPTPEHGAKRSRRDKRRTKKKKKPEMSLDGKTKHTERAVCAAAVVDRGSFEGRRVEDGKAEGSVLAAYCYPPQEGDNLNEHSAPETEDEDRDESKTEAAVAVTTGAAIERVE
ncbi:hypothetical protein WN55_06465 [Dufourea novaeangliae]|uniref:Uncharacterized protein n=1 Tax=Dufourea novaeangliae TaxID=178035 RepID=A0A154P0P7_DUFNO|nr:hypothetical protein WN55_06465 [Dufourea novaeangliae]